MTRRAVTVFAGWFCGLFLSFRLCVNGILGYRGFAVLCAFTIFLGAAAIVLRVKFRAKVMLFAAAFAVAAGYSALKTSLILAPLESLSGSSAHVSGKIISCAGGDITTAVIKGKAGGISARMTAYLPGFGGREGDTVEFDARITRFTDDPFFGARENYLPDGVYISVSPVSEVVITGSDKNIFDFILEYGRKVAERIRENVAGEPGELLASMVTGDRTVFSDSLRTKLNRAGIGHLAAVSGLHVSVLVAAVMAILKKLKLPRAITASVCGLCVLGFIAFSGFRASAIRAGIMLAVLIVSGVVRRRADALNSICVCGLLMTLFNPYSAADSSFVLSMSGVFGVGVMAPAAIKALGVRHKIPKALCASVCASLATVPAVMLWFDGFSLAAPFVNIIAIPLCSFALIPGMIYALLGAGPELLLAVPEIILKFVIRAAELISKADILYLPFGFKAAAASAIILFATAAAVHLIYKDTRKTALLALMFTAAVMAIYAVNVAAVRNYLYLDILSDGEGRAAVLRLGGESVIMDFTGDMPQKAAKAVERSGAEKVRAAVIYDNAPAAYSSYRDGPNPPERYYLPGLGAGIGPEDAFSAAFGSEISFNGAVIKITEDGAEIYMNSGEKRVISLSGEGDINLLSGLAVIRTPDGPEVIKGGLYKTIKLGAVKHGG